MDFPGTGANISNKILPPRKARKSKKFRHINPIKPDIEDSSGALRGAPETILYHMIWQFNGVI